MSLYDFFKRAAGVPEEPPAQPVMAQITILSTSPVKRSSGTRSQQAQA